MDDESLPAADFDLVLCDRTEVSSAPPECAWVEPIESPPHVPNPPDEPAPPAGRESPAKPPAHSHAAVATGRRSLEEIFPAPPRKRQLPKRLRIAVAGLGLFLVVIIALGSPGTKLQTETPAPLADDLVVSADALKNRREVRADDFRPRGPAAARTQPAIAAPPSASSEAQAESLAERRARRAKDPEDVLTLRAHREATTPSAPDVPFFDGPVYVTAAGVAHDKETRNAMADATNAKALATAGTTIPAVLATPLELAGGSATVVARVERASGALRGARFVGTASAGMGRVTVRFHAVLLADGGKARVDAEAEDTDGSFGLRVDGEPNAAEDEKGSVLGDIAAETASDLVSDAIGAGIAGRTVDRVLTGSRSRRSGRPSSRVSLAAGTKLQIFLHEPLEVGP